jgi:magnesium chelatase family protein
VASGQLCPTPDLEHSELYGELALDGELKPVPGVLLAALQGSRIGHRLIVPAGNAVEARLAGSKSLLAPATLADAVRGLAGLAPVDGAAASGDEGPPVLPPVTAVADLADVRGQHHAVHALAVAAAGGHSLLLCGPPGSGKSMLAQRLPGLLPALTHDEAIEVAAIDAIAQRRSGVQSWGRRPFRTPHHTASASAIVGGGSDARPGEVSLAHRGVLFLDELPEFDRRVLESLREPLETGVVSVSRAMVRADYPADFQLVAAMNPCACGYHGDRKAQCRCTAAELQRYRARLSGPLLDRIDLHVPVQRGKPEDLLLSTKGPHPPPSTVVVAAAVAKARARQWARQGCLNARLEVSALMSGDALAPGALSMLAQCAEQEMMSARASHRVLRVARSIADLEGAVRVEDRHVGEALSFRRLA